MTADTVTSPSQLRLQHCTNVMHKFDGVATPAAKRLAVQLDNPAVLPISGRAALKAKLSCGSGQSGGVLDSWEDDLLASQPNWQESRWVGC